MAIAVECLIRERMTVPAMRSRLKRWARPAFAWLAYTTPNSVDPHIAGFSIGMPARAMGAQPSYPLLPLLTASPRHSASALPALPAPAPPWAAVGILGRELMAIPAMRLAGVPRSWCLAAEDILGMRHRFKV